jgi:hypothetical protein
MWLYILVYVLWGVGLGHNAGDGGWRAMGDRAGDPN